MNCDYWKDIVQQLLDENQCQWAAHVLSTMLRYRETLKESRLSENELNDTNLGMALKCIDQDEIVEKKRFMLIEIGRHNLTAI